MKETIDFLIDTVEARQVLDSRGNPTVEAEVKAEVAEIEAEVKEEVAVLAEYVMDEKVAETLRRSR